MTQALNSFQNDRKYSILGMKKYLILFLMVLFWVIPIRFGDTHSIDFERGSKQYSSIPDANQTGLDIIADISFEFWAKFEELPATGGVQFPIVAKWNQGDGDYSYLLQFLQVNDHLQFLARNNGTTNMTQSQSDAAAVVVGDLGVCVHYAVTVDISVPSVIMYKDGDVIASSMLNTAATFIADTPAEFTIASQNEVGDYANAYDGILDDVRVWNDIRTPTEISDNMNIELVGDEAGLAGYWRFNEDLLDATSNDNDLTANNGPIFDSSSCVAESAADEVIPQPAIY